MAEAYRIPTRAPVDDLARRSRADVAKHGAVVWIGRRSQARQLRRLQAALRADGGYETHYFVRQDGVHELEVQSADRAERTICWWGLSS